MSLIQHTFDLDGGETLQCHVFITNREGKDQVWLRGHDIVSYLGYVETRRVYLYVEDEYKCPWSSLIISEGAIITPARWQVEALFIRDIGVVHLLARSRKPKAIALMFKIGEMMLPSLNIPEIITLKHQLVQVGEECLKEKKRALEFETQYTELTSRMNAVEENYETLKTQFENIKPDVVMKPEEPELLHTLIIHEIDRALIFTRCQHRTVVKAMRNIRKKYPHAKHIYSKTYEPNSINVLNCIKTELRRIKVEYVSKNNTIEVIKGMDHDEVKNYIMKFINDRQW